MLMGISKVEGGAALLECGLCKRIGPSDIVPPSEGFYDYLFYRYCKLHGVAWAKMWSKQNVNNIEWFKVMQRRDDE